MSTANNGRVRSVAGFLALAVLASSSAARADVRAMAEALYEEGRRLLAAGRTAEACAKFDESNRLAPATGALLNLAACNETLGNTATAWAQFRSAQAAARRDNRTDRVEFAQQHITQLEGRLSHLTIVVPPELAAAKPQIDLDGAAVGPAAWNVPVPIDPGAHRLTVVGRGAEPHPFPFAVRPDERSVRVDLTPAVASVVAAAAISASSPSAESAARRWRLAAFITAGAAAGTLAVGSYFGLRAFSEWDRYLKDCTGTTCPPSAGDPGGNARFAARTADVTFGVGLAAGAAAGIFYYLSKQPGAAAASPGTDHLASSSRSTVTPVVSKDGGGLRWSLQW